MRSCNLLALGIALFTDPSFAQGYTNESEVPLYGQSPPVYPTRKLSTVHVLAGPSLTLSSQLKEMARRRPRGPLRMLVPEA